MANRLNSQKVGLTVKIVVLLAAAGSLFLALRPSPDASLEGPWRHIAVTLLPSFVLFGIIVCTVSARYRMVVLLLAGVGMVGAVLLRPVCVPISASEVPAFESVRSFEERAAEGEPFCRLYGRWFQCKSYIARSFFF